MYELFQEMSRYRLAFLPTLAVLSLLVSCSDLFGPGAVRSLEVAPAPVSLAVGDSTHLQVRVRYADGSTRLEPADRWSSESPGVATVDGRGDVVGVAPGFARVDAWRGGVSATTIAAVGPITYQNVDSVFIAMYASDAQVPIHLTAPATALNKTTVDGNRPAPEVTYWTSIAYVGKCFYVARAYPDGTAWEYSGCGGVGPQLPRGVKRVLVLIIDPGDTNIAELVGTTWAAAEDSVNQDLKSLFRSLNEKTLLQFNNTNILVPADSIHGPVTDADSVFAYMAAHGIDRSSYDVIVALDMNRNNTGGFANTLVDDFVSMGCYVCAGRTEPSPIQLDRPALDTLAQIVYDHEIGHLFGWWHQWGGGPEGTRIITMPALFGWTDTNGDGVPEIMSSTPYGLH